MSNTWLIIENNKVINHVVAESEEIIKTLYPNNEIMEDNGIVGIGWERIEGIWKSKYPEDGLEYTWNISKNTWETTNKLIEDIL